MRTCYLRFCVYAIKIMGFQRSVSSNLPMLLVSLYASQFFRSLSIAYNEGRLYLTNYVLDFHFTNLDHDLENIFVYFAGHMLLTNHRNDRLNN